MTAATTRESVSANAAASAFRSEPPLAFGDRGVRLLLCFALVLQVVAWTWQSGYPLADAVEFMDRAHDWVDGRALGGDRTIRSFAYSAVFVPLFGAAHLVGLEDLRPLMPIARCMQVALALGFVFVCARFASRFVGRRAGYATGALAAMNPFFLLYSSWPISGVAAALFVTLGLERLIVRSTFRRELVGGLYLGVGFLMAYQTLLVILAVLVGLVLRDTWKHKSAVVAVLVGLVVMVTVQVGLDRVVYGEWGGSVWRYTIDNIGGTATGWLLNLGFRDAAERLYSWQSSIRDFQVDAGSLGTRQRMPRTWYIAHFHEMFVAPVIALGLVGAWRAWRDRVGAVGFLFVVFLANLAVMSFKGEKSYRLWLPLLATLLPAAGLGFAWLTTSDRARVAKRGFAWAAVSVAVVLGFVELDKQPLRRHGVYWEAIEHVNAELEAHPPPAGRKVRVGSAYPWAVFLRTSPSIEMVRFDQPLEAYAKLTPDERAQVTGVLDSLDALLVHLPVLTRPEHAELFRAVNERFRVRSTFYDQRTHAELGPLYVLERHRTVARARRFFEVEQVDDPAAYAEVHKLQRPIDFVRETIEPKEQLTLLGFEVEPMPGSEHQWITYHWYAATDLTLNYRVIDRITAPDNKHSWHNNHYLAYDALPPTTWKRGTVLRESYLLVASADAFYANRPYEPLGGAYRRGDAIPARLWIAVLDGPEGKDGGKQLVVRDRKTGAAPRATIDTQTLWNVDGWRFSPTGLVQIGGLNLPVHPWARVPDDGRPLPE
ncbi:MAG: hypothetical protein IT453_18710 [Planctomycetes bacterium]|nr:hypothetical protein [Planctomycetota bacterium]